MPEAIVASPLRALHADFRSFASRLWHRITSVADRTSEARSAGPYVPGPEWHRSAEPAPNASGVGSSAIGNAVPRARSGHSAVLLGVSDKESFARGVTTPRIVLFGAFSVLAFACYYPDQAHPPPPPPLLISLTHTHCFPLFPCFSLPSVSGGFDETSYIGDVWELHLERLQLNASAALREAHCGWREHSDSTWTPCLRQGAGTAASLSDAICNIEELIARAWCSNYMQSFYGVDAFFGGRGAPDAYTLVTAADPPSYPSPIAVEWLET